MALDRLALVVQGKKLWPVIRPLLEQAVANKNEWKVRAAGLTAIAQCAEVIDFKDLPVVAVCSFVRDAHPRVRYAAVHAIGQIANDFPGMVPQHHRKQAFPALIDVLKDYAHPRLQSLAASSLLNLVDGCKPAHLKPFFTPLMQLLAELLRNAHQMVQSNVLPVIAAIAGELPAQFAPHYSTLVPPMIYIIRHATSKATRMLRAKAMEAVSFIGMSMGKDMFINDARILMQIFMDMMNTLKAESSAAEVRRARNEAANANAGAGEDDYSEQYMLQAWPRICSCLGAEFLPALPFVFPLAAEVISRNNAAPPDPRVHKLVDEDGNDGHAGAGKEGADAADSSTPIVVSQVSSALSSTSSDRPSVLMYDNYAHTAAMEDKAIAMDMVASFCIDLKAHFLPYVEPTALLMLPNLTSGHEDVQEHAISCMQPLMHCAAQAHKEGSTSNEFVQR
jgi:hypothetical protein